MKVLQFKINIQAPKEKVWDVLWNDETYRQWTAVFQEGSHAVSDWEEGSKIHFLSPGGDGMYGVIDKKILHEQMTFKHLGVVKGGEEQPADHQAEDWGDGLERYYLTENDGVTELTAEMNAAEAYIAYFEGTFPKALEAVKRIAEQ